VDGDGVDDIFTGAAVEDSFRGTVYVWLTGGGMDTIPDAWMKGEGMFSQPGWRVASAGDVDGDGRDEIVFSNYALQEFLHTVWVCKYTATGTDEQHMGINRSNGGLRLVCDPNPFKNSIELKMISAEAPRPRRRQNLSFAVRDLSGRLIRRLETNGRMAVWDGKDTEGRPVPAGVYFAHVAFEGSTTASKLIRIR